MRIWSMAALAVSLGVALAQAPPPPPPQAPPDQPQEQQQSQPQQQQPTDRTVLPADRPVPMGPPPLPTPRRTLRRIGPGGIPFEGDPQENPGGQQQPQPYAPPVPSSPAPAGPSGPPSTSFAPAEAVKPLTPPPCETVVSKPEAAVDAAGGPVEVIVRLSPPGCEAVLTTSPWVQRMPAANPMIYRFSVDPNPLGSARQGIIGIGDQKILITQAAAQVARFATSPGHLSISVEGEKAPHPRTLALFSDDPNLTYQVQAKPAWLAVTAIRKAPSKAAPGLRRFHVTVDPARLRTGRNEGLIVVTASGGTVGPSTITIPVTVETPRPR